MPSNLLHTYLLTDGRKQGFIETAALLKTVIKYNFFFFFFTIPGPRPSRSPNFSGHLVSGPGHQAAVVRVRGHRSGHNGSGSVFCSSPDRS